MWSSAACAGLPKMVCNGEMRATRDLLLLGIVDDARTAPVEVAADGCFALGDQLGLATFTCQMTRWMRPVNNHAGN